MVAIVQVRLVKDGGEKWIEMGDKTNRTWRERGRPHFSYCHHSYPFIAEKPAKETQEKLEVYFQRIARKSESKKNPQQVFKKKKKPAKLPRLPTSRLSVHGGIRAIFRCDFYLHICRNQHCTSQG